jgi:hypothetical protein
MDKRVFASITPLLIQWLGYNLGLCLVLIYAVKITLSLQLVAITLAAVAAALFWALAPMTASLLYIHPNSWNDADLVRHLWHFRLIQPEWVSGSPQYDYMLWTRAETLTRLAVVFIASLGSSAWIVKRHHYLRTGSPPNHQQEQTGADHCKSFTVFRFLRSFAVRAPVAHPECWP